MDENCTVIVDVPTKMVIFHSWPEGTHFLGYNMMQESSALQKKEQASLDLAKYPSWLEVSDILISGWLMWLPSGVINHGLPERKSPI